MSSSPLKLDTHIKRFCVDCPYVRREEGDIYLEHSLIIRLFSFMF